MLAVIPALSRMWQEDCPRGVIQARSTYIRIHASVAAIHAMPPHTSKAIKHYKAHSTQDLHKDRNKKIQWCYSALLHCLAQCKGLAVTRTEGRGLPKLTGLGLMVHTVSSQLAPLRRQAALQRGRLAIHYGRRCRRAAVLACRAGPCGAACGGVKLPWTLADISCLPSWMLLSPRSCTHPPRWTL